MQQKKSQLIGEKMDILSQYYKGITLQLRSEVDFINSIFHHQGLKGDGNETALRELITRYLPKRYGVGTGIVIDHKKNQSRQCDIIIYDTFSYPALLSLATIHLFPVDIVYAVIEVKTTLTAGTAKEAIVNIASVRSLDIISSQFILPRSHGGGLSFTNYKPTPPFGCVFAYNSDAQQFETFKNWFVPQSDSETALAPTFIGCLDQGLIRYSELDPQPNTKPLGYAIPVMANETTPVVIKSPTDTWTDEGITYPVKKVKDHFMPIDQSRVFLSFMLKLSDMLSIKQINPSMSFANTYLSPEQMAYIAI